MSDENGYTDVLQRHVSEIVSACLELTDEVTSIILYGSYGRGEGSWYKDVLGGWHPYNDFDIRIVTDRRISAEDLRRAAELLAENIGTRWIDLSVCTRDDLTRLKPSVLNYEMKTASTIIYGDESILNSIPKIDPSTLPPVEVQTLYFTRLFTLLGSLDANGVDQELGGEASRFFRNQMAKAVLAVADVHLLNEGLYHSLYKVRIERYIDSTPGASELHDLVSWALAEKLKPQATSMSPNATTDLYRRVQGAFVSQMSAELSKIYRRSIAGPEDIEHCLKWLPRQIFRRLYWALKFRGRKMERQLSVLIAQSYIATSWGPNAIDQKMLSRGLKLLSQVDSGVPTDLNWDRARLAAAELRMVH